MRQKHTYFQKEEAPKPEPIPKSEIIYDKDRDIKYRKGEKLGIGGFGEVYEFINIETGEKRAAKIIKNSKIDDPQSESAYLYEKKFNELLGFKYLCKCYNVFKDELNRYFILDYMPNKTLKELNEKRKLSELEIKHYCFELLLAIEYLHKMNIIHRDIKLSNVLLNENMEVRLCDFGLAIDNSVKETKNICGTLYYIAPELYDKKAGGLKYSFETDIWAFGVLMYTLFFHKTPFIQEAKKKIDYNIQAIIDNCKKDNRISKEAKELILSILVKDPNLRPKIEKIKSSAFFRNGKGIPKFLPAYTLERPMKSEEEEQFVNNAISNGECLDSDNNLPDRIANRRKYTNPDEMDSDSSKDDSSSKEEEEDDNNNNNVNEGKYINNNNNKEGYININANMNSNSNNNINENYNESDTKEINKQFNSISFSNFVEEKTNPEINDNEKNINIKNTPKFTNKVGNIQNMENIEIKINNNNKKENTNNIKEKVDIKFNEIKIYNKNTKKEKFENDKNNNELPYMKISSKENIKNNINDDYIIITKYIDLSDKCGLGYILSNEDIGICFNDGTKMIKIKSSPNIIYIDEKGDEYLINLKKKIKMEDIKIKINALMLFIKEFIKNLEHKNKFDINPKNNKNNIDLFVKKWFKSQYAYFFLLSNEKMQIIFEDKTQLFFDFFAKKISYTNKRKENIIYIIDNNDTNKIKNEEMDKKIKYAKRVLRKI